VPDAVNRNPVLFFDHYRSATNRLASRQYRNEATRQTAHRAPKTSHVNGQKSNSP
jgi:hypothetical protein